MRSEESMSITNDNDNEHYYNCDRRGAREKINFLRAKKFLIAQLIYPIEGRYIPLQNLEVDLVSGIVHKYDLECIIAHSVVNAYSGHKWLYIRIWYIV